MTASCCVFCLSCVLCLPISKGKHRQAIRSRKLRRRHSGIKSDLIRWCRLTSSCSQSTETTKKRPIKETHTSNSVIMIYIGNRRWKVCSRRMHAFYKGKEKWKKAVNQNIQLLEEKAEMMNSGILEMWLNTCAIRKTSSERLMGSREWRFMNLKQRTMNDSHTVSTTYQRRLTY